MSKSTCTKHTRSGPLLEVAMSIKCTPLWREAHFEVKRYKAHQVRTTFGSWDVEKVHTVVARSTFRSQKWKKNCGLRNTFGRSDALSRGRGKGLCTLSKVSKTWGLCSISKKDGRRGTLDEDLQRWISRGRRSTRDMLIRDVRRLGRWFPERGCILEHQIFRFAEMILLDRRSTSYDLASLSCARRSALDRWSGKIAKRIGTRPSALHSTFHFWRKSPRILSFLMLSTSKIEGVSQHCFVFDVVKFNKNWGSLAELFRFWRCNCNWNYNYHYITLITLHCTALHCATVHYTTHTTLHYTTLRYTNSAATITTLHYAIYTATTTTLPYTRLHHTTQHYTTLRCITLH